MLKQFLEAFTDRLAGKLAVVAVSAICSGLLGFRVARAQEREEIAIQVEKRVEEKFKPVLDSLVSKNAQILFGLDQVMTPDQKARAAANFNQAKTNLGLTK